MCDWIRGELLITFPDDDPIGVALIERLRSPQSISGVSYQHSLQEYLGGLHLRMSPGLGGQFHRVKVPAGEEAWFTTEIQAAYQRLLLQRYGNRSDWHQYVLQSEQQDGFRFTVAPNHYLGLTIRWPRLWGTAPPTPIRAADFHFSANHAPYLKSLDAGPALPPASAAPVRVLILDTGVASDAPISITKKFNFVDVTHSSTVTDEHGHGTAIALTIHEVYPHAEYVIYQVADASGKASEWDTLAALASDHGAHVVNISLSFGLTTTRCSHCGSLSESSRSRVFEALIQQLEKLTPDPVVVAAAGNDSLSSLSYPSRFKEVVAVEAVTSSLSLAGYSNHGELDAGKNVHPHRFVLPGGDLGLSPPESIGAFTTRGGSLEGTSFAAAYATGLVARSFARQGLGTTANKILDSLRTYADTSFSGYSAALHGSGAMRA